MAVEIEVTGVEEMQAAVRTDAEIAGDRAGLDLPVGEERAPPGPSHSTSLIFSGGGGALNVTGGSDEVQ